MELFVTFAADRIRLPLASSEVLQGLIYYAMQGDPLYAEQLHETGLLADGRSFKLFHFSELSGRYEICDKDIIYLSQATLQIRSAHAQVIQLLFSYFLTHKTVRLGANTVAVRNVRLADTRIFDNSIRVHTLSPVTVYMTQEDGHTVYFSPEEDRFYAAVCTNARRKWVSMYGSDNGFELKVSPIAGCRYVRRATRFKRTFITAWHGSFLLEGNPQTLDFLFQTGIGAKNSQGFGMIALDSASTSDKGAVKL